MNNTSPIAACTIVSKNYLSLARVWNASVQKHHPGMRTFVLIVDRVEGAFDAGQEPFEVIEVERLGIPDFPDLAFKYNILELNTAVKPFLLEYIFQQRGVEQLVYFDPDTVLYGPIDKALAMLEEKQIVVVPHILSPQAVDGLRPNETDFLISGAYNLGFLALRKSEEVLSFLRWWQERLIDACFSAPERGLFTDQKWIDLVPSIFSGVGILKDRGYNAAYWNLHERMDLEARNGGSYRFPECPADIFPLQRNRIRASRASLEVPESIPISHASRTVSRHLHELRRSDPRRGIRRNADASLCVRSFRRRRPDPPLPPGALQRAG